MSMKNVFPVSVEIKESVSFESIVYLKLKTERKGPAGILIAIKKFFFFFIQINLELFSCKIKNKVYTICKYIDDIFQSASLDSNPSSPASIGRKETKGNKRKQSFPSKAPTSPSLLNYSQESNDEQAQDFTAWSNKIKEKVKLKKKQQKSKD